MTVTCPITHKYSFMKRKINWDYLVMGILFGMLAAAVICLILDGLEII